jgi:hypothetical protein
MQFRACPCHLVLARSTDKSCGSMTGMGYAKPRVAVTGKTRWTAVYLDLHGRERSGRHLPQQAGRRSRLGKAIV